MDEARLTTITGSSGEIAVHEWDATDPSWIAILVHGYGEHLGRYQHVADALRAAGATVSGPDHQGHGRSDGERVLIDDFESVVNDLDAVVRHTRLAHPDLPVVMIGHSLGGMIAARYAQRHSSALAVLVLSGPVIGSWESTRLADLPEIPDDPLDVSTLSRDPAVGEAYAADPLVWHGPFKRGMLEAIDRELRTINAGGTFGALPTLWIHGSADEVVPIGPSREGLERVKGSDFTEQIFPGARHEVFNETNRDEVLAVVTDFARRHLAL